MAIYNDDKQVKQANLIGEDTMTANGGITTGGYVANEMYDRMNYGRGYGEGYGGMYANTATIQHGLANNRQASENQADCTREVLGLGTDSIRQSFDAATRAREFAHQCKSITDAEFRTMDRQRDIEREMNANARAAADCCCETQKELLKMQALSAKDSCETQKEILRLDASNNLKFAELGKQQAVDNGITQAKLAGIEAKIDANKEIGELRAQLGIESILSRTNNGCGVGPVPCTPCS